MKKRALMLAGLAAGFAVALAPEASATAIPSFTPFPSPAHAPSATTLQENVEHVTNVPGSTGGHVVVEGDRLYMGTYGYGMRIFDISDPENPEVIGEYIPGPALDENDPGARADAVPDAAVFDGQHIAILNGTNRTASTRQSEFLDVTDPANPILLHRFRGPENGEAHNGDIVDERRLWLPSGRGGDQALRIYDLNPLLGDTPAAPELVFSGNPFVLWQESPFRGENESAGPPFTGATHDITVYTDYEVLLPQEQWVDQDGDEIPDPTSGPRDIALLAEDGSYEIGPDDYTGEGAENDRGSIFIIDITDPRKPVIMDRWANPDNSASDEPIRYYHEAQFLDGNPNVMIVADESLHTGRCDGDLYIVEVSPDLSESNKVSEWLIPDDTPAPVCSVHVFSSHEDDVFVGSYNAGLQVVNLGDPENPERVGHFIAPGADSWGALWHDGLIYVGDLGARGLDVFRFTGSGN